MRVARETVLQNFGSSVSRATHLGWHGRSPKSTFGYGPARLLTPSGAKGGGNASSDLNRRCKGDRDEKNWFQTSSLIGMHDRLARLDRGKVTGSRAVLLLHGRPQTS